MLTIGQLASYAGVTVRAVRHYHAKGLLPEPERDHSGYRRYDTQAVVDLIRIKTLAEAGVPLSRVKEMLAADGEEFARAVGEIDARLAEEIASREQHRERIGLLVSGDGLALPQSVTDYLGRLRALGFHERVIAVERDSWIMVAAQAPERVDEMMEFKVLQIEIPELQELYREISEVVDCGPDDPRLGHFADRFVAFLDTAEKIAADHEATQPVSPELTTLLDAAFLESFDGAPQLLKLLEERGWRGWTNIERIPAWQARPMG